MRVLLLGPVVNNYVRISDRPVHWNIWYVLLVHNEHSVCTHLSCFIVPLAHPSKIFAKRHHPSFLRDRIFHELFVARDGFACDGVDHGHCIMRIVPLVYWLWLQFEGSKFCQVLVDVIYEEEVNSLLAYYPRVAKSDVG